MTELPKILEKLLKIVSAKYGTREKNIDISLELSKKISNDSLEVKITNDIAGGIDPAPGIRKTAFIEYYFNGEKKNVEILENEILKLP